MLMISSGTNHIFKEHDYFDHYGSWAIPSKIMQRYSYPAPNEQEEVDQYHPYTIPSKIVSW